MLCSSTKTNSLLLNYLAIDRSAYSITSSAMRTEMVIRMQASSEKGSSSKAMKVAAAIDGVESVTLAGEGRNLLRVVGDGVDSNHLTTRLRRKVGHADIVQLRTLQGRGAYTAATTGASGGGGGYYSTEMAGDGATAYGGQYSNHPARSYPPVGAEYYHQPSTPYDQYYPSAPPYATSVVHYEYPAPNDPNNCSIM